MKNVFTLLFLVLSCIASHVSRAAVTTDSHTYIVHERESKILCIDRITGKEYAIDVHESPKSFQINGDFGYVLYYFSSSISIIDLSLKRIVKELVLSNDYGPDSMVIHGDKGYFAFTNPNTIKVINLKSLRKEHILHLEVQPKLIQKYGDHLYILERQFSRAQNIIYVLDVKTMKTVERIQIDHSNDFMHVNGDFAYVGSYRSPLISVIDLKVNKVVRTIKVEGLVTSMFIKDNNGYVLEAQTNQVTIINLSTQTIDASIPVRGLPLSIAAWGDYAYVKFMSEAKIALINLKAKCLVAILKFDDSEALKLNPVDISDTDLYVGTTLMRPLYPTEDLLKVMEEKEKLLGLTLLPPDSSTDAQCSTSSCQPQVPFEFPKDYLVFMQALWLGNHKKAEAEVQPFLALDNPAITGFINDVFMEWLGKHPEKASETVLPSSIVKAPASAEVQPSVESKAINKALNKKALKAKAKKEKKAKAKKAKKAKAEKAKKAKAAKAANPVAVTSTSTTSTSPVVEASTEQKI